jgi:hypothetical protein
MKELKAITQTMYAHVNKWILKKKELKALGCKQNVKNYSLAFLIIIIRAIDWLSVLVIASEY